MQDLPALLDVDQLAVLLRMSRKGVRDMIRRGEIPASKLGRRWRVRRDALERVLRQRERRATAAEGAAARLVASLPPPRRGRRGASRDPRP